MKNYFRALAVVAFALISQISYAQIETPLPSPKGTVSTKVGLTDVSIEYFRPQVKGRKIFGELVAFDEVWRTGANGGTKVTFGDDVKVGGKSLAAGTYQLLSIPSKTEWTVIFYTDTKIGGNMSKYSKEKDAVRLMIKPSKIKPTVQMLTFNISDLSENSEMAAIELTWENTSVKIPVTVSYDDKVMASIKENIGKEPGSYAVAARYYLDKGKDMDQALEWINTYLSTGENSKQFWQVYVKAKILAAKGDKEEAIKVAKESKKLASESKAGDFGYIKRNEDLIASLK
ncbi:DUF2911 domain-containing protein [Reichenbachiella versicolor]|uniref:DUF2911 domain-containing protein n=1 Tax=Reichenbachiella versicolor TaxID=1821036 RepID=UPI000D6EA23E|nr:DUF2911 domain-containing protein [Reichenbachiella versicolor]